MNKTIRLTSQQRKLLAKAAKRPEGKLLSATHPIPVTEEPTGKAIASLLRRSLLIEIEVAATEPHWRSVDGNHYGLAITDKGREAIGFENFHDSPDVPRGKLDAHCPPRPPREPRISANQPPENTPTITKIGMVVELLEREQGATLHDLGEATGWLPHTIRAAMTGLKKKGRNLASTKVVGIRTYRICNHDADETTS